MGMRWELHGNGREWERIQSFPHIFTRHQARAKREGGEQSVGHTQGETTPPYPVTNNTVELF